MTADVLVSRIGTAGNDSMNLDHRGYEFRSLEAESFGSEASLVVKSKKFHPPDFTDNQIADRNMAGRGAGGVAHQQLQPPRYSRRKLSA
jgi:hypothetical protein